jgi:hypothetical protein
MPLWRATKAGVRHPVGGTQRQSVGRREPDVAGGVFARRVLSGGKEEPDPSGASKGTPGQRPKGTPRPFGRFQ